MKPAIIKILGLGAVAVASFAGPAEARTNISVSIGAPVGGYYYEPAPVIYSPAPVVYAPRPVYYYQPTVASIWWSDGSYRHHHGYDYGYWRGRGRDRDWDHDRGHGDHRRPDRHDRH